MRALLLAALTIPAACRSRDTTGPTAVPASITRNAGEAQTGTVGTVLPVPLSVRVRAADGTAVANARVQWDAGSGSGSMQPSVSFTNADGLAQTQWSLGQVAGTAKATAQVGGVNPVVFTATALPGPVAQVVSLPDVAALGVGDTLRLRSTVRDQFGNEVPGQVVAYATLDANTVSVTTSGLVTALASGSGRIVATAATRADTVVFTVGAAGASPCGSTAVQQLAVGQVFLPTAGAGSTRACLGAPIDATADFGLVLVSAASSFNSSLLADMYGIGIGGPTSPNLVAQNSDAAAFIANAGITRQMQLSLDAPLELDRDAELRRRLLERRALAGLVDVARDRFRTPDGVAAAVQPKVAKVGDILKLNSNALAACENPDTRTGRVAAVGTKSIIVVDTLNPAGGYTDAEFASIAATFDTLIYPVDTDAFGTPTDISGYGKIILFYSRAVNALTPQNAGFVVGGFFFARDLYPKVARSGLPACAASNEAEIFYLLVPDPNGTINGNRRSKDDVSRLNLGTIAHEFQHLINSSRRLYVTPGAVQAEETWLDEGLSHIAEELLYLRLAGFTSRQNLGVSDVAGTAEKSATFSNYGIQNFGRLYEYLRNPEANSPYAPNDSLSTRGAIWSFLRYAGEREGAGSQDAFFRRLVNSSTSGLSNLMSAVPSNQFAEYLRDWSVSNLADDYSATVTSALAAQYRNPTWNFRSIYPALRIGGQQLNVYPLATRSLFNNIPQLVVLPGGATSYVRFSVPAGKSGVVSLSSKGTGLPATARVAVVRLR